MTPSLTVEGPQGTRSIQKGMAVEDPKGTRIVQVYEIRKETDKVWWRAGKVIGTEQLRSWSGNP